ncbi:MAG: hypothetical protein JW804_00520 [Sedimentisphaerales bacterium]|nr:hypothetical protein [Sedimentisphaerales bacterium]
MSKYNWLLLIVLTGLSLFSLKALAIVLHPEGEPNLTTWTDRPDANALGRFGSTANFVTIAPNWILTTRHQIIKPATLLADGTVYDCNYNPLWQGGPAGNADIQLVRLTKQNGEPAGIEHYVEVFDNTNEVGINLVIGGHGDGRAGILTESGTVYGYTWDRLPNTNQRWCTNRIDNSQNNSTIGIYTSNIIIADFDDPGQTTYEGAPADHDSGCGWFVKISGNWKLAGLSRASEAHYVPGHEGDPAYRLFETWFRKAQNPLIKDPDYLDAVRVGSYASWINSIIHTNGDINGDDWVDIKDFALLSNHWSNTCSTGNNYCDGTDLAEPFGVIDFNDLAVITENWLDGWQ